MIDHKKSTTISKKLDGSPNDLLSQSIDCIVFPDLLFYFKADIGPRFNPFQIFMFCLY